MLMCSDVSGGRVTMTIGIPPSRWHQWHQVPLQRSDTQHSQELWGTFIFLTTELTWNPNDTLHRTHYVALTAHPLNKKVESLFMCISLMYRMFPPSSHRPKLQPKRVELQTSPAHRGDALCGALDLVCVHIHIGCAGGFIRHPLYMPHAGAGGGWAVVVLFYSPSHLS